MASAHTALMNNFVTKLAAEGDTEGVQLIPTGFEYAPEDSQFSSLAYTYQVSYTA